MAGLMSPALQEQVRPSQPMPDPQDGLATEQPDTEESNVSPEEQRQYDAFVNAGLKLLYEGGKVRESILDMLDDDPADLVAILGEHEELKQFTPSVALAATAVVVVLELVRQAGDDRPEDAVILHGGREILEELADLVGDAKIHDFSQDELNKAFYLAMDLWRESAAAEGLIDMDQLKSEFETIKTADAEGRLGDVFGGQQAAEEPAIEGGSDELRG